MAIATAFVLDTWKGSRFMRTLVDWNSTLVDWLFCLFFIGIPVIVGSFALFTGSSEWWTITSITWFVLVFAYFVVFAISAVYYEVDGCLELIRYHPKLRDNNNRDLNEYGIKSFIRAINLRMKQRLSGHKDISYTAHGSDPHPDKLSYYQVREKDNYQSSIGFFSRITRMDFMSSLYTVLDEPKRLYNVEDVLEFTPYITGQSWGLESVYCRNRDTRFIAIVDGVGAISKEQSISSVICFFFGTLLSLFAITSLLAWLGLSTGAIIIVALMYLVILYKSGKSTLGMAETYKSVMTKDGNYGSINRNRKSDALYQVRESFRISEPRRELCYLFLGLEVVFFFIIPLIALFSSSNNRVGIIFIFMGVIYLLRDVCNAPACLRELGSLDGMELNNKETDGTSEWREKNRFGKIIGGVSVGKGSRFWIWVFVFFTFAFCVVLVSAFALGSNDGATEMFEFASRDEFIYEGSKSLDYASCAIGRNIKTPDNSGNSLADFAFLSTLAYNNDDSASSGLSSWFGDSVSVDNLGTKVSEFKETYQEENGSSAVLYKLFDFPDQNLKIVAVRGTSNAWDALSDAQLWSSAALSQYVRAVLPLGEWWTPILPHIVKAISVIEDKALKDVAYYRETTAFVQSLKDEGYDVQIVGHCKFSHLSSRLGSC